MAQEQIPLFNFYHRYKWNEVDFTQWQQGMVELERAMMEGLFNGAVMSGFELTPDSGLDLTLSSGIAIGPTGYLMVENDETAVTGITAPGSNVRKDLIVARPKLVESEPITRPTSPFDTVYLKQLQDMEIVRIEGTPDASPEYPAKQAGDVIICGIRIQTGQSTFTEDDIDYEVRDIYGKNSNFQQNAAKYDDRLRPFRSDSKTLGLKPSQLIGPHARAFTFINQNLPSIFPKNSSGDYNHEDTFLDFETGGITGGDESSPDFTPTIPTAGNWINAVISVASNDELQIDYGIQGTRAQCLAGIKNRETSGAGSLTLPTGNKIVAIAMVKSSNGTEINELESFDYRGQAAAAEGGGGGLAAQGVTVTSLPKTVVSGDKEKVLLIDTTSASGTIELPPLETNFKFSVKDVGGNLSVNKAQVIRPASGDLIEDLAQDYDLEADFGAWHFICDGTGWSLL